MNEWGDYNAHGWSMEQGQGNQDKFGLPNNTQKV